MNESPDTNTPKEELPKDLQKKKAIEYWILIKKLKLISLIVSIVASIWSVWYYLYSIWYENNNMLINAKNAIIINESEINNNNPLNIQNTHLKSVIEVIQEIRKNDSGNNLKLEYLVGKITSIDEKVEILTPQYTVDRSIGLKIQKNFDVKANKSINGEVACTIDKINANYIAEWQKNNSKKLETPGRIKIKIGDSVGFKYNPENNICEVFQINENNLKEFNQAKNNILTKLKTNENIIETTFENFWWNHPGSMGSSIRYYNHSGILELMPEETYNNFSTAHIYLTTYFNNNLALPLLNLSCRLAYLDYINLWNFYRNNSLDPITEKGRIKLTMKFSWYEKLSKISSNWDAMHVEELPSFDGHSFKSCQLIKVDLMDLEQRNIIETYTFN